MNQAYIQRFAELFLSLTGIRAEDAIVGDDGWVFVPPEMNMDEKLKYARETIKALGWREHLEDDKLVGWWVKPWKNIEPGFVALTLSDDGAKSFTYLKDGKPGQRHVYFIDRIQTGGITGAPMLLGQFVFEFEGSPAEALRMSPCGSNRIYYPRDRRVVSYDPLTEEERQDTENRLRKLAETYPAEVVQLAQKSVFAIERLVQAL